MSMLLIFSFGAYLGLLTAALMMMAGRESDSADDAARALEQRGRNRAKAR